MKKQTSLPGGSVDAGTMGAKHDANGAEIIDDRPVAVPLRFRGKAVSSYQDAMQLLQMASRVAEQEGMETEEEANDFEVDDIEFEGQGSSVYTEQDEREVLKIHKRVLEEQERRRKSDIKKEETPPPEIKAVVKPEGETPE